MLLLLPRLVLDVLSKLHSRETNVAPLGATGAVRLRVPHTIIIRVGVATGWYFTSIIDGRLRRRNRRNCNFDEVYKVLTAKNRRRHKRSAVVATFGYEHPTTKAAVFRYMSADQLHAFLFTEEGKPDGWLQEFVEPQGPYSNTIRATWSPCVTRIEVRTNRHQLTDRKVCPAVSARVTRLRTRTLN